MTLTIFVLSDIWEIGRQHMPPSTSWLPGKATALGSLLREDGSLWSPGAFTEVQWEQPWLHIFQVAYGWGGERGAGGGVRGTRGLPEDFPVHTSLKLFTLLFQSLEGGSYRGSLKDPAGCLNEGMTPPTPTRNLEEEQKAKALRGRM